jgi:hypothetical protein
MSGRELVARVGVGGSGCNLTGTPEAASTPGSSIGAPVVGHAFLVQPDGVAPTAAGTTDEAREQVLLAKVGLMLLLVRGSVLLQAPLHYPVQSGGNLQALSTRAT